MWRNNEGTADFKKQTLFILYGIFCRYERDGGGAGGEQAAGSLFFLLTDSLDNCDWHDNDCDGARQSLRW